MNEYSAKQLANSFNELAKDSVTEALKQTKALEYKNSKNDKDLFISHNEDFDKELYTRCVKALDKAVEFKQI